MDKSDRLKLDKIIAQNNVEDVTNDIRERKHSNLIKKDIARMLEIKKRYARLSKSNMSQYDMMLSKQCSFLFNNYTDIFNRLKKDELDLNIMAQFLDVLSRIEDGNIDQHEGAFLVGKLLKEIYIDSAMKRGEKLDKKNKKSIKSRPPPKKMSYSEYKQKNKD